MKKLDNIVDVLMIDNITNRIIDNIFIGISKRLRGANRVTLEKCLGTVTEVAHMACYSALLQLGYDIPSAFRYLTNRRQSIE